MTHKKPPHTIFTVFPQQLVVSAPLVPDHFYINGKSRSMCHTGLSQQPPNSRRIQSAFKTMSLSVSGAAFLSGAVNTKSGQFLHRDSPPHCSSDRKLRSSSSSAQVNAGEHFPESLASVPPISPPPPPLVHLCPPLPPQFPLSRAASFVCHLCYEK